MGDSGFKMRLENGGIGRCGRRKDVKRWRGVRRGKICWEKGVSRRTEGTDQVTLPNSIPSTTK